MGGLARSGGGLGLPGGGSLTAVVGEASWLAQDGDFCMYMHLQTERRELGVCRM